MRVFPIGRGRARIFAHACHATACWPASGHDGNGRLDWRVNSRFRAQTILVLREGIKGQLDWRVNCSFAHVIDAT